MATIHHLLGSAMALTEGESVFAYRVQDPERYGVVDFDSAGKVLSLKEKPKQPKSNCVVTGLYFYDQQVVELAKNLKPSARGELETTDLNRLYLEKRQLNAEIMRRGYVWLDTVTHDSLFDASEFISVLEKRQGFKVACSEEIAYRQKWIDGAHVERLAQPLTKTGYGQYLLQLLRERMLLLRLLVLISLRYASLSHVCLVKCKAFRFFRLPLSFSIKLPNTERPNLNAALPGTPPTLGIQWLLQGEPALPAKDQQATPLAATVNFA